MIVYKAVLEKEVLLKDKKLVKQGYKEYKK